MADLTVNIAGVEFKNPVITASGTFGFGREYSEFYPLREIGGLSCKGITLKPRMGNPPPRIAETPSGILNAVGLQNPGVDHLAEKLSESSVDMIEMNISCPNVKHGGVQFGTSCQSVGAITREVRAHCKKPLMVKLSPNVSDIAEIARAAESEGADALSLINTLTGMRIDINTRRPIIRNNTGGLSGPAVFPVAVRMVWQTAGAVKIPVVGMGGISTWRDAVEMMLAGASAIQVGTALFSDPYAPLKIKEGLNRYLDDQGIASVTELAGMVKPW